MFVTKLRTKAKKIKAKALLLKDLDQRLLHLNSNLLVLDKIDSKTDMINQRVESMTIQLSNTDFSDKTVDERMKLFADDIVLRLGRIEGQDYTMILNDHMHNMDCIQTKCYDLDKRLDGLSRIHLTTDRMEARLVGFDHIETVVAGIHDKIGCIDIILSKNARIEHLIHD